MKKYLQITMILAAGAFVCSCYNDRITFDDFEYQTVYFPYQYPVRTLSLGNDVIDNSLDLAHEFNAGICIGGYYGTSKKDWDISFEVDESLVDSNLYNAAGKRLKVMPSSYYTMKPSGKVTLKAGTSSALVRMHLADEFFEDPSALDGSYVIPLKITQVQEPLRVLRGTANEGVSNPNRHKTEDWEVLPMDYTLFGVKYVNKFHGSWLRRGVMTERSSTGEVVSEITYRKNYVEYDEVVSLVTTSLQSFTTTLNVETSQWTLDVTDDGSGCLSVASSKSSKTKISTGSGTFKKNGDSWGGTPENPTKRDAIYLDYFFKNSAGNMCEVLDTLVFRDRGIVLEVARPTTK